MAVELDPWYSNNICFIGDAAHALFPFYGAGLNTGLEDVTQLIKILESYPLEDGAHEVDWPLVFKQFYEARKVNTDGIGQLTKMRMNDFANSMGSSSYKEYRKILDYLNNNYSRKFWSTERLVRCTQIPYGQVLQYFTVEQAIVNAIKDLDGYTELIEENQQNDKVQEIIKQQFLKYEEKCSFLKTLE